LCCGVCGVMSVHTAVTPSTGKRLSSAYKEEWEHVESNDTNLAKIINSIAEFRIGYRRFRKGEAKGAQRHMGDITRDIKREHLRVLPVAQLKQLQLQLSEMRKPSEERIMPKGFLPTAFHVHFGAGKLGLGLISTALAGSGQPFAIVDPPLDAWKELLESKSPTTDVIVNGTKITQLQVLRPGDPLPSLPIAPGQHGGSTPLRLFVCSSDDATLATLIKAATSMSTSVGPALPMIGDRISGVLSDPPKDHHRLPTLFGCENDHKAVDRLANSLAGRVDVVCCMVDRICTGRELTPTEIRITTEPDPGAIVVMTPPEPPAYAPAFGGECFTLPLVEAEAHYFANRKITIVNGMHTTLAFMTLCIMQKDDEPRSHELLTTATLPDDKQREVWAWAVARVLMILWQHDTHIIKHAHCMNDDIELARLLLGYARRTLNRFATISDTTGRILSGGVTNRYQTRLQPVDKFLMSHEVGEVPLGKIVLKEAELTEGFLLRAVRRLVEDAYRFTGLGTTAAASHAM